MMSRLHCLKNGTLPWQRALMLCGATFASEITLLNFRQTARTLAFYLFLHLALLAGLNLSGLFRPNRVGHPFH